MNSLLTKAIALLLALFFTVPAFAYKERPSGEFAGLDAATRGVTALSVRENVDFLKPPLLGWVKSIISLPVKYDKPLRIVVQSNLNIQASWCEGRFPDSSSAAFKECVDEDPVAAFYRLSTSTIHFPDDIDMSGTYGIGTLMHELTHYVQHITGRTRILCTAELEVEAFRNELLLADVYPMAEWITDFLNKQIKQFDEKGCTD